MSNTCFVTVAYRMDGFNDALKLMAVLEKQIEYARGSRNRMYFGSGLRYMEEPDIRREGNVVFLSGGTVNCFTEEDAMNVVAFAKYMSFNGMRVCEIDYEETNEHDKGRFVWRRGIEERSGETDPRWGVLTHRYILDSDWPDGEWDEDDNYSAVVDGKKFDDEAECLEYVLNEHGLEDEVNVRL